MSIIGRFLLDYLWGKIIKEGIPALVDFIKKNFQKAQINKEVDEETDELERLRAEAREWTYKNPGQQLPKELEDKLRDAARARRDGLQ